MPPCPKPAFDYDYEVDVQINALRTYEQTKLGRAIPPKQSDRVLIATWNIANLGEQERRDKDYQLLAEILGWFDLIALQEVNDNLAGLRAIHQHLGADYRLLFSDASGNDERMAFVYDATKLALLEEVGEVAPPPSDHPRITLPGIQQRFDGFDRNPYLATFRTGAFTVSLVNVHLYFGSDSAVARNRRSLEAFAVARWAENRRKSPHATTRDIIPPRDFNLPQTQPGDAVFDAGLEPAVAPLRAPRFGA